MNEESRFEPQTVRVPEGEFLMGSTAEEVSASVAKSHGIKRKWFEAEQPQGPVHVSAFEIGRYPVTNLEYRAFVQETGHQAPDHWEWGPNPKYPEGLGEHPVVRVSWDDAWDYCEWLSHKTGKPYRLPTEAEWEKAARGTDGRAYPWGDEFDTAKCNSDEDDIAETTPVGQYSPGGDSPYGAADMAGNVWEWCSTLYRGYPYRPDDREDLDTWGQRVVRGGSSYNHRWVVRCAFRLRYDPDDRMVNFGFRVVASLGSPE
jgi:formylglycine-generating enzyme required for sulfatase activity